MFGTIYLFFSVHISSSMRHWKYRQLPEILTWRPSRAVTYIKRLHLIRAALRDSWDWFWLVFFYLNYDVYFPYHPSLWLSLRQSWCFPLHYPPELQGAIRDPPGTQDNHSSLNAVSLHMAQCHGGGPQAPCYRHWLVGEEHRWWHALSGCCCQPGAVVVISHWMWPLVWSDRFF